jgi:uncharacterized protein YggE
MFKSIFKISLISLLMFFIFSFDSLLAQEKTSKQYIKVKGTGLVRKEPDIAYVNLTITVLEKNSQKAYEQNLAKSNVLIEAGKEIGLSPEDFENNFSLNESINREGKRIGFSATNSVKVTLGDFDLLTKLVDISADFVTGSRVSFGLKDYEKVYLEALDSAFINAKAKAEVLAEKSNLQLGEVISIDEAPEYAWGFLGGYAGYRADEVLRTQVGGIVSSLVLNPQKINVTSNIVVIFEAKKKE